ncbi:MAG: hypothetical protein LBF56_01085 [Holosporales bacterium]|jgi:hypothetical protein|nr:hypothetical protein [Holosporales bacterium]
MSSNRITAVERIALLVALIQKYCFEIKTLDAVRLAKDLANTIDECKFSDIHGRLEDEFMAFFPEHWTKRTQFLLVVSRYWPEILHELGKDDVEPRRHILSYHSSSSSQFVCTTRGLSTQFDPRVLKNKVHIMETEDIFEEISFITSIIEGNPAGATTAIVSPSMAFSLLLTYRLKEEGMSYTSYVSNEIDELPPGFLREIHENFEFTNDAEKTRIADELSPFAEVIKSRRAVSIVGIDDIKFLDQDLIICTEMNESVWRPLDSGQYWLHSALHKKLGLTPKTKQDIEDDFYACFNDVADVYLLRSKSDGNLRSDKSSILSKFEAVCRKHSCNVDYIDISNPAPESFQTTSYVINKSSFKLPDRISTNDVDLLMRNPLGFYAKKVLNLCSTEHDENKAELAIAFKNFMKSRHSGSEESLQLLEVIKAIDPFWYQKCQSICDWFDSTMDSNIVAHSGIQGQIRLHDWSDIELYGTCDRLEEHTKFSRLIIYKMSAANAGVDILHGGDHSVMATCLIAEDGGFGPDVRPIKEVQILAVASSTLGDAGTPIEIKNFKISSDMVDAFEKKLYAVLSGYSDPGISATMALECESDLKYNKFKHFERT